MMRKKEDKSHSDIYTIYKMAIDNSFSLFILQINCSEHLYDLLYLLNTPSIIIAFAKVINQ